MGLGIWNNEWLSQNSQRRYPLSEAATGKDVTGLFSLPDDLIVDLIWSAHISDTTDPALFQLLSVTVSTDTVVLYFGYNGTAVFSTVASVSTHTKNKSYRLISSNEDFYDSLMTVTLGSLDNVLQQPAGTWTFNVMGGQLEPTTIRPDIRSVSSIVVRSGVNSEDASDQLYGEVELAAGSNLRLSVSTTVEGRKRIRIDAINGEGFNEECDCGGASLAPPIRRINGIPSDAGDFTLEHGDCLSFDQLNNGIKFNEECADPCCGCEELQVLNDALNALLTRTSEVEQLAETLSINLEQTRDIIMVSRLGTRGTCPP